MCDESGVVARERRRGPRTLSFRVAIRIINGGGACGQWNPARSRSERPLLCLSRASADTACARASIGIYYTIPTGSHIRTLSLLPGACAVAATRAVFVGADLHGKKWQA